MSVEKCFRHPVDDRFYEIGQRVSATNGRHVPRGSEGYIVSLADPQIGDFISVVFLGSTEVSCVSPEDIIMA